MELLFQAIETRFAACADLATAVNGLFFERAPARQAAPFIRYRLVDGAPRLTFGPDAIETVRIEFAILSEKPQRTEALAICQKLTDAFDLAELAIPGYSLIALVRESTRLTREERRWRCAVGYRAIFAKE